MTCQELQRPQQVAMAILAKTRKLQDMVETIKY